MARQRLASLNPADEAYFLAFNIFANKLMARFALSKNPNDLDMTISETQQILNLAPAGHFFHAPALCIIGQAFTMRFKFRGDTSDLTQAVSYVEAAVAALTPEQSLYLPFVVNLASSLLNRYWMYGDVADLSRIIETSTTALSASLSTQSPYRDSLLNNLATALKERFAQRRDKADLDTALMHYQSCLDLRPPSHPSRHSVLGNLADAMLLKFEVDGHLQDLESAANHYVSALQLRSPGQDDHSRLLDNYGAALQSRYTVFGNIDDLDQAIQYLTTSSDILPSTYSGRPVTLLILGIALVDRFTATGNIADLDSSIEKLSSALQLCAPGYYQRPVILSMYGCALSVRYNAKGDLQDLSLAASMCKDALTLSSPKESTYSSTVATLTSTLLDCFQKSGNIEECQTIIDHCDRALASMRPGEPTAVDYGPSLVNLGRAFFTRFQAQRNKADLDAAIERASLACTLPTLSERFSSTFALASLLYNRYTQGEDLKDLEQCVKLFNVAEEQMPLKHLSRTTMLHNYARAMYDLGRHRNHLQDFNVAIGLFKEAIKDVPASHSYLPWMHLHLAEALHERANRFDDVDGHHEAIKILLCVIETLPDDSPALHSVCHGAAIIFMTLYELSNRQHPSLMEEGFQCFKKAARYTYGSSFMSVYVALLWVKYAKKLHHSSALLAYQTSLDALDQHLLVTASIKGRHAVLLGKHLVAETSTLATDAMACAIPGGELELAVELSEQGRGLLWSQLSRSRTPLNALRSAGEAGRALASDFERVNAKLSQSIVPPEESLAAMTGSLTATEAAARRYRQLSQELQDIIGRIRRQEGFQSFLRRPSFESLQCAAVGGPVILVNISDERCDAVIVLQDAPPRLVPLPNTSLEALTTLSAGYYHMLQMTSRVGEEKMREREVLVVLRTLWDTVVSPIVDELASLIPRGSRIWWCPTSKLTTLPLHAAGPYRKGTLNLPNIYVSSYTPTLAALIRARRRPTSSASTSSASTSSQHTPPAFIAIGQAKPASSTGPALQTVSTELALVQSLLPRSSSFSVLDEEASTADAALTALATHGWAHIACHGYPNAERPFDAAFALKDERVTVLDIADASIPGEFAFLSACHTAVGDRNAPDEIIHLAATMQFVGYRSVIGTMWAVDDSMARHMVKAFYASLFASGGNGKDGSAGQDDPWDCTRAARALNKAAKLVDKDLVSVDQRIVFIHIGA
ncbi:CHAT domain-containing protein [Boletus edulis BED1]|uniref:CHAT domain-containing protein n=1 Tax=Boletus edulis BED1 TaxID=1328754 RepID=A0AAD4BXS2_BOLED|nr:CHAT domain-containing protein [Boletus edulis BED1]